MCYIIRLVRAGGRGSSAAGMGQSKREAAADSSSLLWHFIINYCYEVLKQLLKVLFKLLHQQWNFSFRG